MWCSMLVEGSELNIEIHKKHSHRWRKLIREPGSEEGPIRKANIKFDDLRKHLSSRTRTNRGWKFIPITPDLHRILVNFEVKFDDPIQGLQLWLAIKVRYHHRCYAYFHFKYNGRFVMLI